MNHFQDLHNFRLVLLVTRVYFSNITKVMVVILLGGVVVLVEGSSSR